MNSLVHRCLTLTGSFETGHLPPDCWSALAGDFDGRGISFSALQWNIGKGTLQPLLKQMLNQHMDVMSTCFGPLVTALQSMLVGTLNDQLVWARSIQSIKPLNGLQQHVISPFWVKPFAQLGLSAEWQSVAMESAAGYFDKAKFQAAQFRLTTERAMALLFDCAVQNGEVNPLAFHTVIDSVLPSWGEPQYMRSIAEAVAMSSDPRWRDDVLRRKLCIANGSGIVHGINYDLPSQFGL